VGEDLEVSEGHQLGKLCWADILDLVDLEAGRAAKIPP
jgi:hypothetical protein